MVTVDVPTGLHTTRRVILKLRDMKVPRGSTAIIHEDLVKTMGSSTDPEYPVGPPVQAIAEGIEWRGEGNIFNDATKLKKITVPDGVPNTDNQITEPRSFQGADGKWYGGAFTGFEIVGSNSMVENVTWIKYAYGQSGCMVDTTRPYPELNKITLCKIHHTYGDGVRDLADTIACDIRNVGRHGAGLNADYPQRVHLSILDSARGRAWYRETGHRAYGKEIVGCAEGGNAGYFSGPAGAPGKPGFLYQDCHSTTEDLFPGYAEVSTLTNWEWDKRLNFSGPEDVDFGIVVRRLIFDKIDQHILQGMKTAAVTLCNVDGGVIEGCKIPAKGPFGNAVNSKNITAVGNDGTYTDPRTGLLVPWNDKQLVYL